MRSFRSERHASQRRTDVTRAKRQTQGSNLEWTITVQPDADDAVTVTLPQADNCDDAGAVCSTGGAYLSNSPTATVNGPNIVAPALSIDDATETESDDLGFTVSLSEMTTRPVSVEYAISGGTATSGDDFTETSGTLSIAAGQSSGTITVPSTDDSADEDDETVEPRPTRRSTMRPARGTIEDDDEPPLTASFSDVPDEHDGSEFSFDLDFTDNPELSYRVLRDEALEATKRDGAPVEASDAGAATRRGRSRSSPRATLTSR